VGWVDEGDDGWVDEMGGLQRERAPCDLNLTERPSLSSCAHACRAQHDVMGAC
jgi:hypothetical protein